MRLGVSDEDQIGMERAEDCFVHSHSGANRTKFSADVKTGAEGPKVLFHHCGGGFDFGFEPLFIGGRTLDCLGAVGIRPRRR
jgi:hypothetical protein